MKILKNVAVLVLVAVMCLIVCVGYAAYSTNLSITGVTQVSELALHDVYITNITPNNSAGVTVKSKSGTVMFAEVSGSGTATFRIDVKNISEYAYVFDRVIDGAEAGFEGAYMGSDITYTLNGISRLDEIAPSGGTLSFDITINVPSGVTAEYYILNFNFIDKYGIPGDEYLPEEMPEEEVFLIQRLADILNNRYKTDTITDARTYLIKDTIKVISWNGTPYVGNMDEVYMPNLKNLFGKAVDDVSFILKNQDINWDGYNEISLYSTSDTLDSTSKDAGDGVVCVYATVFTPVLDDQKNIVGYNMVCEALRGYCGEVRYAEDILEYSFSTDSWRNDIGYWAWSDELGTSYIERVPVDAMSNSGDKPFREDFDSYNKYYIYNFWATAPWGDDIRTCLGDKIPYLS